LWAYRLQPSDEALAALIAPHVYFLFEQPEDFADYNATWFALLHVVKRLGTCDPDSVFYFSNASVGVNNIMFNLGFHHCRRGPSIKYVLWTKIGPIFTPCPVTLCHISRISGSLLKYVIHLRPLIFCSTCYIQGVFVRGFMSWGFVWKVLSGVVLFVPLLSEYIHYNRKLIITLNFRFHMYENFCKHVTSHTLGPSPWHKLTHLLGPPPSRAWLTLWMAPSQNTFWGGFDIGTALHWFWAYFYAFLDCCNRNGFLWGVELQPSTTLYAHIIRRLWFTLCNEARRASKQCSVMETKRRTY